MKLTIVGAGAVGTLWGCRLTRHHQVHFWTRQQETRLRVAFTPLDQTEPQQQIFPANDPTQLSQSDVVLVTVKAFQLEAALSAIAPYLGPQAAVVIMHNGMGTHPQATAILGERPILYATTAQGAMRPAPGHTQHTGLGQTWLGALNQAGKSYRFLTEQFDLALPPCQWHEDIFQPLWQKLAINCAINPLTALHQCRNGELARAEYSDQLNDICNEVARVMTAEGYPTEAIALRQLADQVIEATAKNFSSMNQDICQHRTTEIDYITGYLIARAEAHQIAVPANTRLWQQIKQLEQQYNDQ